MEVPFLIIRINKIGFYLKFEVNILPGNCLIMKAHLEKQFVKQQALKVQQLPPLMKTVIISLLPSKRRFLSWKIRLSLRQLSTLFVLFNALIWAPLGPHNKDVLTKPTSLGYIFQLRACRPRTYLYRERKEFIKTCFFSNISGSWYH